MLYRLLSHIYPIRVRQALGKHGPLELTWENGRLVVNSANANQSFGSLHRVWRKALADAGVGAFRPANVLILGFGAGSAAHILRMEMGMDSPIVGVDHDPVMLAWATGEFGRKALPGVELVHADAFESARANSDHFDLILVDLFADDQVVEGVDTPSFMDDLRRLAGSSGRVLINTMTTTEKSRSIGARSGHELRLRFSSVKERRYERDNRVFIAL